MAPIAIDGSSSAELVQTLKARVKTADPSVFPDGLKTSGKISPIQLIQDECRQGLSRGEKEEHLMKPD